MNQSINQSKWKFKVIAKYNSGIQSVVEKSLDSVSAPTIYETYLKWAVFCGSTFDVIQ